MRIAIDIDGVLAEFNAPACDLLTSLGVVMDPLPPSGPTTWNYWEALGATKEDVRKMWGFIHRTPSWWGRLPAHADFTPAVRETLWDLINDHEVTFVTSRPGGCRDHTEKWIQQYTQGANVHVLVTPHRKPWALTAMEPQIIIEDKLETLQECYQIRQSLSNLPKWQLILVDRPYNQGDRTGMTVVRSTGEALECAIGAAGGR